MRYTISSYDDTADQYTNLQFRQRIDAATLVVERFVYDALEANGIRDTKKAHRDMLLARNAFALQDSGRIRVYDTTIEFHRHQ